MSLRKSSRLQQLSEDRTNLRRSSRVPRSLVVFTPTTEKQMPRKNPIARCENKKRKHKSLQVEYDQQLPLAPSGKPPPPLLFISQNCVCVCV